MEKEWFSVFASMVRGLKRAHNSKKAHNKLWVVFFIIAKLMESYDSTKRIQKFFFPCRFKSIF